VAIDRVAIAVYPIVALLVIRTAPAGTKRALLSFRPISVIASFVFSIKSESSEVTSVGVAHGIVPSK